MKKKQFKLLTMIGKVELTTPVIIILTTISIVLVIMNVVNNTKGTKQE
ncbi:hypothetical protein [Virgibacillus subterraneus]|nr:hypothetical protein [Virgibacillus subterraneus]